MKLKRDIQSSKCFSLCLLPCRVGMHKLYISIFLRALPVISLSFGNNSCGTMLSVDHFYVTVSVDFNL